MRRSRVWIPGEAYEECRRAEMEFARQRKREHRKRVLLETLESAVSLVGLVVFCVLASTFLLVM